MQEDDQDEDDLKMGMQIKSVTMCGKMMMMTKIRKLRKSVPTILPYISENVYWLKSTKDKGVYCEAKLAHLNYSSL